MSAVDADLRGRWRIVETEVWDKDVLDLLGPAEISFGDDQGGELRVIAIGADVDYRVTERNGRPCVEFSWSGFDDGEPASGRGLAERDGERMVGMLFIHRGDESSFVAERPTMDRLPTRRGSGRPRQRPKG